MENVWGMLQNIIILGKQKMAKLLGKNFIDGECWITLTPIPGSFGVDATDYSLCYS